LGQTPSTRDNKRTGFILGMGLVVGLLCGRWLVLLLLSLGLKLI